MKEDLYRIFEFYIYGLLSFLYMINFHGNIYQQTSMFIISISNGGLDYEKV